LLNVLPYGCAELFFDPAQVVGIAVEAVKGLIAELKDLGSG